MTINATRRIEHNTICPGLRVSSIAMERTGHWGGDYTEIETWIFSDFPQIRSRQFHHRTEDQARKFNRRAARLLYAAAKHRIDEVRLFLEMVDFKLGMEKSDDLLTRIGNSSNETAWQAQYALLARQYLKT